MVRNLQVFLLVLTLAVSNALYVPAAGINNLASDKEYGEPSIILSGNGLNKPLELSVTELVVMEDGLFSGEYTMQTLVEPHNGVYTGIKLSYLLGLAGFKDTARSVKIVCEDGVSMEFDIEEILAEDYINNSGASDLPVILAFKKGDTALVLDTGSKGYNSKLKNDGGPLRLVVGQKEKGERNSPKWLQNVREIVVSNADSPQGFNDIGNMYIWAEEAINDLAEKGIVSGTGNGKFEPERPVSRAELSFMWAKAFNLPANKAYEGKFNDVKAGDWYSSYVQAITDTGILSGMGGGAFAPDAGLTRNQISLAVANTLNIENIPFSSARAGLNFRDKDNIPDWCVSSIYYCEKAGLFDNIAVGYFNGDSLINRAEAAVIIHRLMNS